MKEENKDCNKIKIEVVYSNRKSFGLQVTGDGQVIARLPYGTSKAEASKFVKDHEGWIRKKLAVIHKRQESRPYLDIPAPSELTPELRAAISSAFAKKVAYYADIIGVTYGRITIRNQKTRWGSCSSLGNLNFNYKLYFFPEELMDYVVVHELTHRIYMDHSWEFWRAVGKVCPNYEECERQLKLYQ